MVSDQKARANRRNAQKSTGPKTAAGRSHSAQNAFRHGLSLPVSCFQALSAEVEVLAREIAGPNAGAEMLELARRVAEAQIDVHRARTARQRFLSAKIDDPNYESRALTRKKVALLLRSLRYLLRPNPPTMLEPLLVRYLNSRPQGPRKLATVLSEESRDLLAIDRYERQAMSRRKFAIRAYDVFDDRYAADRCCRPEPSSGVRKLLRTVSQAIVQQSDSDGVGASNISYGNYNVYSSAF